MRRLYYEIELPLERVLAEMENAGCAVAPDALRTFGERLETRIRDLVDQIYLDAGAEFNLNSTRQLGEILFERLGLPAPKRPRPAIRRVQRCSSACARTIPSSHTFWNTAA